MVRVKRTASALAIALAAVCIGQGSLPVSDVRAAPTAWQDNTSGFAIGGYDPVAYFTKSKPVVGSEGIEYRWGGTAWRFANTGNREAFVKHPQVYAPRFAGYDPEALARGVAIEGSPVVWAIHSGRVYLFRDVAGLRVWRADPARITRNAKKNWDRLSRDLPGTTQNRP